MLIVVSRVPEKAAHPIRQRQQSASKVTEERSSDTLKHILGMPSIVAGRQIVSRPICENAHSPISARFEGDSNVNVVRPQQSSKAETPICWTDPGRQKETRE
jgi:hypothetical protein